MTGSTTSRIVSAIALLATLGSVAEPAMAQRYGRGWGRYDHGYRGGYHGRYYGPRYITGGWRHRHDAAVAAGIGVLVGAGIAAYMDRQERELRADTAGTDIRIRRDGDRLMLNMPASVTFASDQSALEPGARATLDRVARTLARYPSTYVDVYGHTDSQGDEARNQALSERRATQVADYLSTKGVDRARIATQGFGETEPVADNNSAAGRAANRRVELRLEPVRDDDQRYDEERPEDRRRR